MTALKPRTVDRLVFNPLLRLMGARPTLVVTGRKTGNPIKVTISPIEVDGKRYLVGAYGDANWVRNVRANNRVELQHHGKTEELTVREVPVAAVAPIIAKYREAYGKYVVKQWNALPDDADHPVFELTA